MARIIVAVTGMPASRKSLFANKLKELGYEHVTLSSILQRRISLGNSENLSQAYKRESHKIREELGPEALVKIALDESTIHGGGRMVIDGVRSLAEFIYLQQHCDICYLVAVQSSPSSRRKRLMNWPDGYYSESLERVAELEAHELILGTSYLISLADHILFLPYTDDPGLDDYFLAKAGEIDSKVVALAESQVDSSDVIHEQLYVNKIVRQLLEQRPETK
jgi:dephospho-CoA kinase